MSNNRRTLLPPCPETGRLALIPPPAVLSRLLQRRVSADRTDLFATDADDQIRTLGRLALRRDAPIADDSFALGDLCAQRSLVGDRLLVLYAGKVLAAYRRA